MTKLNLIIKLSIQYLFLDLLSHSEFFTFLKDVVAVNDAPYPGKNEAPADELDAPKDHCDHIEPFRVHQGGNDGARSRHNDVQNKQDDMPRLLNLDNSITARLL